MALEEKSDDKGNTHVKATGTDVHELLGAFSEINKEEKDRRLAEAGVGERAFVNKDGGHYIAKEKHHDRAINRGEDVAEHRPGAVMPSCYLGMTDDGRIVWTGPGTDQNYEQAETTQGLHGWAVKSSDE